MIGFIVRSVVAGGVVYATMKALEETKLLEKGAAAAVALADNLLTRFNEKFPGETGEVR